MPSSETLPIEALPGWARLNGLEFLNCKLDQTEDKGIGLVATSELSLAAGDAGLDDDKPLLKVPRDVVLGADTIEDFAKVDQNFRQLLDVAGKQTPRGDILVYMLAHLVSTRRGLSGGKGVTSTAWTEYLKFLPREVLVPTLWSSAERVLLEGTSLEQAVYAKQNALDHEFDQLREKSSGLPFWDSLFWDRDACTISDWALVDAWYRSRCLELPTIGDAMVPCVDMANHSNDPDAYYDEDSEGDVEILLRPGFTVKTGDEVSITYGKFKSAAEMLFSYGFIDPSSSSKDEMTLAVESFPDDPLAQAKVHMFGGLPTVRLSRTDGKLTWESAFLHFMVLNEEDGLDFRILQDNDGGRELRLFWQEEDVTGRAQDFETITKDHPHSLLFRLRAVTVLAQQLSNQLDRIRSVPEGTTGVRKACVEFSKVLKDIEGSLLEDTLSSLEKEQAALLADDGVKAILGAMEASQNDEQLPTSAPNEGPGDDFS